MSHSSQKKQSLGTVPWLMIILIVVVIIIAGGVFACLRYFPGWQQSTETSPQSAVTDAGGPEVIKSYIGKITEIKESEFVIKVLADQNLIEKDISVTVVVDGNTQISKTLREDQVAKEASQEVLDETQTISFADLKVGDEVTVLSSVNIKGKSRFVATTVQVSADEVYDTVSYVGEVLKREEGNFTIKALAEANSSLDKDTNLVVQTTATTKYAKINTFTPEEKADKLQKETIKLEDIKDGDLVLVTTKKENEGKKTFEALEIAILVE